MKKGRFFCVSMFLLCLMCNMAAFADSSYVISKGKTMFANVGQGCVLQSENSQVSSVNGHFISAQSEGNAKILVIKNGVPVDTINTTICPSEGIKCCYTTPNIANLGVTVMVHAITDDSVEAVKFFINEAGNISEIVAANKVTDGSNYIFSGSFVVHSSGKHLIWAKFLRNGVWSDSENSKTTVFADGASQSSVKERRASDNCIRYIANKEGFRSSCQFDNLSRNSYDIGYGNIVSRGEIFYNNITQNEAYARLVNVVNRGIYSHAVNDLLVKNNVKCTQNQFDALVSFTYNLGPRWTYSSAIRDIILRSGSSSYEYKGWVSSADGLNLRVEPTTNSRRLLALRYGEKVDIMSNERYNGNWVKVHTKNGVEGYCCGDYMDIKVVSDGQKDLSLVDKNLFIKEILQYHHAAKRCYKGLFYRRIEELQIFFNNDFSLDGAVNKCNFPIPECILPILRG